MSRFFDYISALLKVSYDKSAEYAEYYLTFPEESSDTNSEVNDSMRDYEHVIDVENYQDESTNKRLYKKISVMEELGWLVNSEPTHIIDNLYLGNAVNAGTYYPLKELDINVIFNITREIRNYYPDDFIYERFDIYDNNYESIEEDLEKAYQCIKKHQEDTEGNILIHCHMGASRSATVLIYYLMKEMKNDRGELVTHTEALEFLRKKRPIVNPTFRLTKDLGKSVMVSNPNSENELAEDSSNNESTEVNDTEEK